MTTTASCGCTSARATVRSPRTQAGGGWGTYDRIVNIRDVDRDGRSDPIAESGTEEYALLTVYKSTGNWKAPPAPARSSAPAPRTRTACTVALSGGPTRHKEGETEVYTWTRYADGIRTRLAGGKYGADPGTDTVVRTDGTTRTFLDMATGEELVSYDLAAHGEAGAIASVAYRGTTLVVERRVDGKGEVHLIDKDDRGQDVDRKVTGLPETWWWRGEQHTDPSTLMIRGFVSSDGTGGQKLAFVDLATASVTATHDILNATDWITPVGGSRTRAVWQERDATGKTVLAVARRDSLEVARTTWAREVRGAPLALGITDDWVVYGNSWAFGAWNAEGLRDLTARSLTTDESFPLLAHATSVVQAADGGLIATGGTVEHGEGVYRITPGANGSRPAVSVLATTGVPTALTARSEPRAPSGVVDLDAADGKVPFSWTPDRPGALVTLKVVHTASRATGTLRAWQEPGGPSEFRLDWDGFLSKFPAYAGAYTWTMTAEPRNGIGPAVERTGSFVVAPRTPPARLRRQRLARRLRPLLGRLPLPVRSGSARTPTASSVSFWTLSFGLRQRPRTPLQQFSSIPSSRAGEACEFHCSSRKSLYSSFIRSQKGG